MGINTGSLHPCLYFPTTITNQTTVMSSLLSLQGNQLKSRTPLLLLYDSCELTQVIPLARIERACHTTSKGVYYLYKSSKLSIYPYSLSKYFVHSSGSSPTFFFLLLLINNFCHILAQPRFNCIFCCQ